MEHRLDKRVEMPVYVAIHTERYGTFKTCANNLSIGGMKVETDASWGIRRKTLVTIEFIDKFFSTKIPALVLETTATSVSLMFIKTSAELHSFLSNLAV